MKLYKWQDIRRQKFTQEQIQQQDKITLEIIENLTKFRNQPKNEQDNKS